jgi:hypothetical protein
MSDFSERLDESDIDTTSTHPNLQAHLNSKISCSTFSSSISLMDPTRVLDSQVQSTAFQLELCKPQILELKLQRERFDSSIKHSLKIQTVLERPSTPAPVTPISTQFEVNPSPLAHNFKMINRL